MKNIYYLFFYNLQLQLHLVKFLLVHDDLLLLFQYLKFLHILFLAFQ